MPLSPGRYHEKIPREREANLAWRAKTLAAAADREDFQKVLRKRCAEDILFFINGFVDQYNPTKRGEETGPFITWDFQEAALLDSPETTGRKGLLWCYEDGVSCVEEKSREMGFSWLNLILQDWLCRFHPWVKCLNISRDADAVDSSGDPDSLFWKLDFIHERLPPWLQQERRQGKERKRFHIYYPETKSTITGEASTGKAGVGGRASVIFVDEFPLIKEDRQVRQRTASTARVRFFNGTHNGTGTEFFKLTRTPEVAKIVAHWCQHPDKNKGLYSYDLERHKLRFWDYVPGSGLRELLGPTLEYPGGFEFVLDGTPTGGPHPGLRSPWYDRKSREIGTARGVAEELDIDPTGSSSKPFDPLLIHQLKVYCKPPTWEGDVDVSSDGRVVKLVECEGGPLKLWCRLVNDAAPLATYGSGCDVSAGTGASPSVCSIGNANTGEKVARYSNAHIKPDHFGLLTAALCRLFHGARVAWEHHGPGVQFGKALMEEAHYRNVYYSKPEDKIKRRVSIQTASPGWRPMGNNKTILLRDYIVALTNRTFLNYDEDALLETLEFRYDSAGRMIHSKDDGRDPEAARENHGDNVIADALTWKMIDHAGVLAARQKPEEPTADQSYSVLTYEGRRRLAEARRRQDDGDWGD